MGSYSQSFPGFLQFHEICDVQRPGSESWPEDMPLEENPLIKAIFDPSEEEFSLGFQEDQVDTELSSENVYHVLDADSSQISVIEEAKRGCDLVVEDHQELVNLRP